MASFISACDVAKAALEIERRGEVFYLTAAQNALDTDAKSLFTTLAAEEAEHAKLFVGLAERLDKLGTSCELPAWSNAEEYRSYLSALLDSHCLFMEADTVAEGLAWREALRMAIHFEKDTLLFFQEMRSLVPQSEVAFVERLINEEKHHMQTLRGLLDKKAA